MRAGLAALTQTAERGENDMRLFWFLTGDRLGSRQLMFGIETVLALTLFLLVVRAVTSY